MRYRAKSMVFSEKGRSGDSREGKSKAWIEDLVVDSAYRGKGIGKALMLRAMDEAKKSDVRVVYLTSRPHRTTAHALYREIGFKVVNTNCFKFELA